VIQEVVLLVKRF